MATEKASKTKTSKSRKSNLTLKELKLKAKKVIKELHRLYPDAECELRHENALQLLLATILSAQSTDKTINKVTEHLFEKYRTVEEFANADPEEFQQDIKSTGFYRNKTKSVMGAAKKIVEDFDGKIPDTMEELLTLPGVARKTANVVLGTFFKKPTGVVVDTHIKRLSQRIGLSKESTPEKIEKDLMEILPQEEWIFMGHAIIWHGRRVCNARKPLCNECSLEKICNKVGVK